MKKTFTIGSCFSGIGGELVAASMMGWSIKFFCEINPFCRKVLSYWYPNATCYEDITKTDFSKWRGQIDVLTGGFPCQPFSNAGKRRGSEDDRYLWPHMHRCIKEIRPTWFICENVAGILTMVEQGRVSEVASEATVFRENNYIHRYKHRGTFTLERICKDVEADGYEVIPILIPACAVGAPHRRDRVFFIGHAADTDSMGRGCTGRSEADKGQQDDLQASVRSEAEGHGEGQPTADPAQPGAEGMRQGRQDALHAARPAADTDGDRGREVDEHLESELTDGAVALGDGRQWDAAHASETRLQWNLDSREQTSSRDIYHIWSDIARYSGEDGEIGSRWRDFPSVSPVYRGNDGFPFSLDCLTIPFNRWRNESIRAYGNAIVPQIIYEFFRVIEQKQ